jgi:ribosomal protein L7/L12
MATLNALKLRPDTIYELSELSNQDLSDVPRLIRETKVTQGATKAWREYLSQIRAIRYDSSSTNTFSGKVFAIKTLRQHTGLGLKEAKELVDTL